MNYSVYMFKDVLNFQSLIQQYVGEGIYDSRDMLASIDRYVNETRIEFKQDKNRQMSRQERILKRRDETARKNPPVESARQASIQCPECGKPENKLITLSVGGGGTVRICANLNNRTPKVGCGYSTFIEKVA